MQKENGDVNRKKKKTIKNRSDNVNERIPLSATSVGERTEWEALI